MYFRYSGLLSDKIYRTIFLFLPKSGFPWSIDIYVGTVVFATAPFTNSLFLSVLIVVVAISAKIKTSYCYCDSKQIFVFHIKWIDLENKKKQTNKKMLNFQIFSSFYINIQQSRLFMFIVNYMDSFSNRITTYFQHRIFWTLFKPLLECR